MNALVLAALLASLPGELVVGTLAEPAGLEPHRATDVVAAEVVTNVCDTLVRVARAGGRVEPALATAWATTDQRAWTFTLRPGVRFQDGTPFDATAVVENFRHLQRERSFAGTAERTGPLVVQLTLERANAALLPTLSQPHYGLQSPRQLERGQDLPVGTGPFRVQAVRPGAIELVANPDHWAGAPRLRRLEFRLFADEDALVRALLDGTAHVSSAVGPRRVARLRTLAPLALDSQTGLNLIYLAVNNERAPFRDARARQALSRAIGRGSLLRALGGHGERAHGPLPPTVLGHDLRDRELVQDRDAARRLLAAAGIAPGTGIELAVSRAPRPYLSEPLLVAERLRADLSSVGLDVGVREVPSWGEHVALTTAGNYELALLGWQADTLDANDFLTALLDSGSIGTTNRTRYASPAMDGLLKRARMERATATRLGLYRKALDLFLADMPFVPLFHSSVLTVHRREVLGLVIGPTGLLRFDKAWKP